MKRILKALALCLVVIAMLAGPALAEAQKVDLVPSTKWNEPGGGFVVFNNSAGPNNLEVTVALKEVRPNMAYDVYLYVDTSVGIMIGTIMTNGQGNANLKTNRVVAAGPHDLGVVVTLNNNPNAYYLSTDFISPNMSATLTFK
jgi:hypothetical protein